MCEWVSRQENAAVCVDQWVMIRTMVTSLSVVSGM